MSRVVGILLVCGAILLSACGNGGNSGTSGDSGSPDDGPIVTTQTPVDTQVGEVIPAGEQRVIPIEEIKPYRPQSTSASVLAECALVSYENGCTLGKLPYIGQVHASISVEDVMQRLLVTHDWMGVRFEQMLRQLPADILPLFGSVTYIIIGSEVRPSSFLSAKGQILLDPAMLWLSIDEKRTIASNNDPRSSFGTDLQFKSLYRVTIEDDYAWYYWSLTDDSERTISDIEMPLASLLYHELAHANDYIQRENLAGLTEDMTPFDAVISLEDSIVSTQLYQREFLTAQSSFLYGLAGVRYLGDTPTEFQTSLQADSVGAQMSAEGKVNFYSYSTIREDVAMLFEATMMKLHYNADIHVGFANKPDNYPDAQCDDFKVAWGERNRLAAPLAVPRAKFITDRIMPSAAIDQLFANELGQAVPLREGDGWCESRFLNPQTAERSAKRSVESFNWNIFNRHHATQ